MTKQKTNTKCEMSTNGKHVWIALKTSNSYTGTVGYFNTYVLKCVGCGCVEGRSRYTGRDLEEGNALGILLGMEKCRKRRRHIWQQSEYEARVRHCSVCGQRKFSSILSKKDKEILENKKRDEEKRLAYLLQHRKKWYQFWK
jgi:hypothetical protein